MSTVSMTVYDGSSNGEPMFGLFIGSLASQASTSGFTSSRNSSKSTSATA
jgi:hypothetical protein